MITSSDGPTTSIPKARARRWCGAAALTMIIAATLDGCGAQSSSSTSSPTSSPIWWGDAAWPLETFAKGNDFSGKTVIPFCTSGSSPAGQSGAKLARLAGNRGTWLDAKRFSASTSDAEIAKWVRSVR